MVRSRRGLLRGLCALSVQLVLTATASAVPPVRTMYAQALAREQTARAALEASEATVASLQDVRAVIGDYEAVVKQYPASGYSDNALWQAGCLSLDAFARFGQQQDKDAGIRFLRRLVAAYPTSSLVKRVPEELARVEEASPTKLATIKDIRRVVLPDAVRITIELDHEVPFHEERIEDPARVFVDLPGTRATPALVDRTLRFETDADVVRQVRVGRHPNNMTRIVLDAAGITSFSVYPLYGPYRLVIDCVRGAVAAATPASGAVTAATPATGTGPAATPALLPSRRIGTLRPPRLPSVSPRATALLGEVHIAAAAPPPKIELASPIQNLPGGFSISRQLGLGVSRIVIDPGHGGHDPGAKGKGVTEAELVLDVALRLEALLQKVAGTQVILTRRTDEFIELPERTAIANRQGADLFLSIHANASPNAQAHGVETYFLNFATNLTAAAVAARENAESSQAMGALPDFVRAIALNNKLDESRDLAAQVQHAMLERLKTTNKTVKDLGVKQAPFVVLIGAAMPSVLAEISFVTNLQEAKLLKGPAYRQRIAEALFNAIRKYQTSLKNAAIVAYQ